ncbi:hypothetical protein [Gluconobacter sphaericus]|uniref:hypothetical protein n=1 Tax=Gluconobacter sphaericus TaxID=574987 RepID=UPI001D171343|nr:hypothetical protein [Gluconobacter sphaericus]
MADESHDIGNLVIGCFVTDSVQDVVGQFLCAVQNSGTHEAGSFFFDAEERLA